MRRKSKRLVLLRVTSGRELSAIAAAAANSSINGCETSRIPGIDQDLLLSGNETTVYGDPGTAQS